VFWLRGVAAVFLLAGGAVLIGADWNSAGVPTMVWMAIVWGGPAVIYFAASFMVRKFQGNVCRGIAGFAIVHAAAIVGMAIWAGEQGGGMMILFLLAVTLVGGLGNLAVSAFWAQRAIRQPVSSDDARRGFAVLGGSEVTSASLRDDLPRRTQRSRRDTE
jgi:hypothetical protein